MAISEKLIKINEEVVIQEDLLAQIIIALEGKAAGGGSSSNIFAGEFIPSYTQTMVIENVARKPSGFVVAYSDLSTEFETTTNFHMCYAGRSLIDSGMCIGYYGSGNDIIATLFPFTYDSTAKTLTINLTTEDAIPLSVKHYYIVWYGSVLDSDGSDTSVFDFEQSLLGGSS